MIRSSRLGELAVELVAPALELVAFGLEDQLEISQRHRRVADDLLEYGRRQVVALSHQPRARRAWFCDSCAVAEARPCRAQGLIELDHRLAGDNPVPVPHQHLGDDPAARVLYRLGAAIDHQHAGGDHRAGDRRGADQPAHSARREGSRHETKPGNLAQTREGPGSRHRHGEERGGAFRRSARRRGRTDRDGQLIATLLHGFPALHRAAALRPSTSAGGAEPLRIRRLVEHQQQHQYGREQQPTMAPRSF